MYQTQFLVPGTVLSVPTEWRGVWVTHFGIVTDRYEGGERTVIAGSKRFGQVVEQRFSEFLDGQKHRVVEWYGNLPPSTVVARARASIGRKWKLLSQNCEHLVRDFHGLVPRSPQVDQAIAGLILAVGVVALVYVLMRAR